MTSVVYKYTVPIDGADHVIATPDPWRLLHVDIAPDRRAVNFWALVAPDAKPRREMFSVYATGQPLPGAGEYCGTAVDHVGGFVWHLFRLVDAP